MIDTFGPCTSLSIPFSHVDMCYVVTTVFLCFVCILLSVLLHACMSTTLAVLTIEHFLPLPLPLPLIFAILIFEIPPSHINRFCMATLLGGLIPKPAFLFLLLPDFLPSIRAGLLGLFLYLASLLLFVHLDTWKYTYTYIYMCIVHCAFVYFICLAYHAVQAQQQCYRLSIQLPSTYLPT